MPDKPIRALNFRQPLTPGERFGRLVTVAVAIAPRDRGPTYWRCSCDCGNEKVVRSSSLRSGVTSSCGCLHAERRRAAVTTHAMSRTPIYRAWVDMKRRCLHPNSVEWPDYGGRGIAICDRWAGSFEAFHEDMGPRPSPAHSLDRIDNDGPYSPENCRWATPIQQSRNSRKNRTLVHDGRTMCISEWAEHLGVSNRLILSRLRLGWSVAKALDTPPLYSRRLEIRP